ncbi:uroporphyrinogen-III C-methyltransferase [Aquabacterium sp.]|uniref:uroporphyrinogen-III C-methyltransferase n=1 Tax=Aquabacterium sp. TaxID=1872578 RepID=UPI0025C6BC13|nr:uroporphyrinogen-III C-methyltransferase [Aquabacterium sp.]
MTDTSAPPTEPTPPVRPATADATDTFEPASPDWVRWAVIVLSAATAGAGWVAWNTQKRVQGLEQELVRRQQDTQGQSAEARILANQAQALSRDAVARATLLETRVAEVALQRSQVEDLIKTLSQSRDENLVADIDAGLRVALQQATLTGSADPLVTALQSADERLTRAKQPRLDNVRRAVAKDLDRVRATRVADLASLSIRLDEAVRLVDDVPLLNQPEAVIAGKNEANAPKATPEPAKAGGKALPKGQKVAATEPAPAASEAPGWGDQLLAWTRGGAETVWNEARGLVRLTRISRPEAMLISPEQGFFLRENLKLRLLNARLALLSRQTNTAVNDLHMVQQALPRYFDTESRKTQLLQSMLAEVIGQGQQTLVPRPDDTLAALAAVSGGR